MPTGPPSRAPTTTARPERVLIAARVSPRRPRAVMYTRRMRAQTASWSAAPARGARPAPRKGASARAMPSTTVSRPHRAPEKMPYLMPGPPFAVVQAAACTAAWNSVME